MPRFSSKRAEAFAAYAVTALVRDAKVEGKTFVRITRQQFSESLEVERLHESHISEVRGHLIKYECAMVNIGSEFTVYESDQGTKAKALSTRDINHTTAAFLHVLGSNVVKELWRVENKTKYMAPPRSRERVVARRASDAPIRVR